MGYHRDGRKVVPRINGGTEINNNNNNNNNNNVYLDSFAGLDCEVVQYPSMKLRTCRWSQQKTAEAKELTKRLNKLTLTCVCLCA